MTTPYEIVKTPVTEALTDQLSEGFRQHGIEAVGYEDSPYRVSYVAYHEDSFAGAIVINIMWNVLQIRQLFIEAPYRKKRLGTLLMTIALNTAKEKGCHVAFVETMSFQALGFYQKFGFELEYSRTGFDHGFKLHFLKMDLTQFSQVNATIPHIFCAEKAQRA